MDFMRLSNFKSLSKYPLQWPLENARVVVSFRLERSGNFRNRSSIRCHTKSPLSGPHFASQIDLIWATIQLQFEAHIGVSNSMRAKRAWFASVASRSLLVGWNGNRRTNLSLKMEQNGGPNGDQFELESDVPLSPLIPYDLGHPKGGGFDTLFSPTFFPLILTNFTLFSRLFKKSGYLSILKRILMKIRSQMDWRMTTQIENNNQIDHQKG